MLPTDIKNLILEFHDEFDVAGKKRRINHIIRRSYRNWLTDSGVFSNFFPGNEYTAKKEIIKSKTGSSLFTADIFLKSFKKIKNTLRVKVPGTEKVRSEL